MIEEGLYLARMMAMLFYGILLLEIPNCIRQKTTWRYLQLGNHGRQNTGNNRPIL